MTQICAPALVVNIAHLSVAMQGKAVLENISATVPGRGLNVVVGPNGAGKSTLLRALCGILKPTAGSIQRGSDNVVTMPRDQRSRLIGWLPQKIDVAFPFAAQDLILLGRFPWHGGSPQRADFARIHEALDLVGALHLKDRPVHHMSGGEQQRIWLARLFAGDHEIILLDEPLAALDVAAALNLIALLKLMAIKRTVIVTIHDLAMAHRFGDYFMLLNDGKLIASGGVGEVLSAAIMRSVFGVETEEIRLSDGRSSLSFRPIN